MPTRPSLTTPERRSYQPRQTAGPRKNEAAWQGPDGRAKGRPRVSLCLLVDGEPGHLGALRHGLIQVYGERPRRPSDQRHSLHKHLATLPWMLASTRLAAISAILLKPRRTGSPFAVAAGAGRASTSAVSTAAKAPVPPAISCLVVRRGTVLFLA